MSESDEESIAIRCECIAITPVSGCGRLLALADVVIEIAGIEIIINSVRVEADSNGTAVRLPVDRQKRPLVVLPDEVRNALGDTVLAAGIEAGILKERSVQAASVAG
ncbi:hypothetical protein H261_00070 [Paramagnetospirillum caucaseum]|uniref:Uncharacterized protein n=1 Tax=Paramagnetospirillum caucaseum TaxID=1244869 RepID=M2ZWY1_9PROT|nr:hypothetical protein [Paramagnetospirillum caucaseum]EME71927.1 hypothetical protein H261_00070 [Paramagnetospirillum caucaseum]